MRSSRVFTAVDSHTEGMPTRVVTGGVGRHPRCDDERAAAALHRASRPPPAAPDERAARPLGDERARSCSRRPDPTATGACVYIEAVRMPADVRSRHDRRGDGARRDRHGRGDRAGHHHPARHTRRPGRRRTWPSRDGPGGLGHHARTSRASPSASTTSVDVPGSGRCRTDLAFGGNFYAMVDLDAVGLPFDRAAPARHPHRRAGDHGRDQRHRAAEAPDDRRHQPRATTWSSSHRVPTRATSRHAMAIHPGWFDRSPCGTGTSRADGRAATPAVELRARHATSSTSRSSASASSAGWSATTDRRRVSPAVMPTDHRPGLGHRHRAVPARPRRPVPHGFEF